MLQNPCKTLGFKKNMVYKIPPGGGGGKPYPGNYKELASQPDIDGFLVDFTARENFVEIVNARS